MKKFIFLYVGFEQPTPEIMQVWGEWFESISDSVVDSGNPFGPGRDVTKSGTTDLPLGKDSITGYTIINAKDMNEAEELAKGCPHISGLRIYEAMAM